MPLFMKVRSFLRNLFLSRRVEADLDNEVRSHLELMTAENMRAGMGPEQARRAARMELGGVEQVKEQVRDERTGHWVQSVISDCRFGLRQLRKNPGFSVVAIIALALGIGFSTIIFSIFYNGVLYPFPYRDAQRLTVIGITDTQHNSERFREMYHLDEVAAFRNRSHTFEDIVAYSGVDLFYLHQGTSEQLNGCVVTPNAMAFWGVAPLIGRGIGEQDAQAGASPVALLSYAFWKSAFHEDRSVLGTTMTLNKQDRTIIGVMPRRFGLYGADVYVPLAWSRPEPASFAEAMDQHDPMFFFATGLVKRNVSRETAAADIQVIAKQLVAVHARDYPEHFQMTARPMNEVIVDDFKQTLFLLIAAVVLLLLISSSNVASLLLTHHSARAREIAMRSALGASRGRLIRQLFVESVLLGLAGCLAGCLLAYLGLESVRFVPGINVPGEADMSLNVPVLIFAVMLSFLTTLLFGLSPTFSGKSSAGTGGLFGGMSIGVLRIASSAPRSRDQCSGRSRHVPERPGTYFCGSVVFSHDAAFWIVANFPCGKKRFAHQPARCGRECKWFTQRGAHSRRIGCGPSGSFHGAAGVCGLDDPELYRGEQF